MADILPNSMGQQMEEAGGGQGILSDPIDQQQQDQMQAPAQGGQGDQPRVRGTVEERRQEILQKDPKARLHATPDMQAEYNQIVTRFFLMLHDTRKPHGSLPAPIDAAVTQMNQKKLTVPQAVGRTTAQLLFILHNSIKIQKAKVNANVWFRAADECIAATYLVGLARGIFEGLPPFKGKQPHKPYAFAPQERKILFAAKVEAVRWFGQLMSRSGQISPQDAQKAQQTWHDNIKREIASGQVTDQHVQQMLDNPKVQDMLRGSQAPPSGDQASVASSQSDQAPPQDQQAAPNQSPAGDQ